MQVSVYVFSLARDKPNWLWFLFELSEIVRLKIKSEGLASQ